MHADTHSSTPAPIPFRPGQRARTGANGTLPQCAECGRRDVCLTAGLGKRDLQALDALLFARRCIPAGSPLFHRGDAFHSLYAVRSGTFKSTMGLQDGREQVNGFHLPGDLLGLDALAEGRHASDAIALEDSEICTIPYRQFAQVAAEHVGIQQVLAQALARHIVGEQRAMMRLGSLSAEERVATFLLDMSERMRARGYSAREFHLRMTRAEIGSYLGVTLETVSRVLSGFQKQHMLQVAGRHIRVLDLDGFARNYAEVVH